MADTLLRQKHLKRNEQTKNTVTCRICGVKFTPDAKHKAYCSTNCRIKAEEKENRRMHMCTCLTCGTIFRAVSDNIKYCSAKCDKSISKRQSKLTINEIARRAKDEGISYGEYVAKYNV